MKLQSGSPVPPYGLCRGIFRGTKISYQEEFKPEISHKIQYRSIACIADMPVFLVLATYLFNRHRSIRRAFFVYTREPIVTVKAHKLSPHLAVMIEFD